MTNIIANGGIDTGVQLLMEDDSQEEQVISQTTAKTIGEMMEKVTVSGTAGGLELINDDGSPKAAVKTGTAEYSAEGEDRTHGWITDVYKRQALYTGCTDRTVPHCFRSMDHCRYLQRTHGNT